MKKPSFQTSKSRKTAFLVLILIVSSSSLLIFSASRTAAWSKTGTADYTDDANSAFSIAVLGLDQGRPVNIPLVNAPFRVNEAGIDAIRVMVNWTSTGTGIKWDTLQVSIGLTVSQLNKYDTWVVRCSRSWTKAEATGSVVLDLVLGTDICKAADIVDNQGWYLEFKVTASASAQDLMGLMVTKAAPTLAGKLTITWTSSLEFTTSW